MKRNLNRRAKRKRGGDKRFSPPIPEAIPLRGRNSMAPWEVRPGAARTDLRGHVMTVDTRAGLDCPTCGADHGRTARQHEMGHVAWTPLDWKEQAEGEEFKADAPFVGAVEDGRLNFRHRAAGVEVGPLVCPSDMNRMVEFSTKGIPDILGGATPPPNFKMLAAIGAASMGSEQEGAFWEAWDQARVSDLPGGDTVGEALNESRDYFNQAAVRENDSDREDFHQRLTFGHGTRVISDHLWQATMRAELEFMDELAKAQAEANKPDDEEEWQLEGGDIPDPSPGGDKLWGEMDVDRPPLEHRMDFWAKRWKVRDEGVVPTRPDRLLTDGKMFGRRVQGGKTVVVVDCSGSMSWDVDDLRRVLDVVPASVVGLYSAYGETDGVLRVVAENGKRCEKNLIAQPAGGGNGVDGKALRWALGHGADKAIWISDGGVTGPGRSEKLYEDAIKCCRAGVMRVDNTDDAVAVLKGEAQYRPGFGASFEEIFG